MTELKDQVLTCRDCGASFVFTAGEQAFFAERNFSAPTRCKACRQNRKQPAEQNRPNTTPRVTDGFFQETYTSNPYPAEAIFPGEGEGHQGKNGRRKSRKADRWDKKGRGRKSFEDFDSDSDWE